MLSSVASAKAAVSCGVLSTCSTQLPISGEACPGWLGSRVVFVPLKKVVSHKSAGVVIRSE